MTHTAHTRTTNCLRYAGQLVIAPDQHHESKGRPHLVYEVDGDWLYVVELSHSPQGTWKTDELGGGTYLALTDWRTGEWMPRWVHLTETRSYGPQLAWHTQDAALDAIAKGLA